MNTIPFPNDPTTAPVSSNKPMWYSGESMTAWERVKEALRRDWEQTKHDFGMSGGHELNQTLVDTLDQATKNQPIPAADRPVPPAVIGAWDEAEYPIGYGYVARRAVGAGYPTWNEGIELRLRADWEERMKKPEHAWDKVQGLIRYGYEYTPRS